MSTLDDAIALVNAAPDTAPAPPATPPATPDASQAAPGSAPATAPPSPAVPAETPPAAPVDEMADLMAKLETRRAERAAKKGQASAPDPAIALLQAEIAALKAQPAAAPVGDFRMLVAQHGEVEALRIVGIDPVEYYNNFRARAKDPEGFAREASARASAKAEADRIAKLEAELGTVKQTEAQRIEAARAEETRQAWGRFVQLTESPETGTPLLARLDPAERVERTERKIAWLNQNGYDVDAIDDRTLAKLVEADVRKMRDLLAGTETGATQKPTTDRAPTTPAAPAATLSNDAASQVSGRRFASDAERLKAAIAIIDAG